VGFFALGPQRKTDFIKKDRFSMKKRNLILSKKVKIMGGNSKKKCMPSGRNALIQIKKERSQILPGREKKPSKTYRRVAEKVPPTREYYFGRGG